MPINLFSKSSNNSGIDFDITLFVQKPYSRTVYFESDIEENKSMKNQYKIKNLNCPKSIGDAASKIYVDDLFNGPSSMKNTAHVEFSDKFRDNVSVVKINSMPAVGEYLAAK